MLLTAANGDGIQRRPNGFLSPRGLSLAPPGCAGDEFEVWARDSSALQMGLAAPLPAPHTPPRCFIPLGKGLTQCSWFCFNLPPESNSWPGCGTLYLLNKRPMFQMKPPHPNLPFNPQPTTPHTHFTPTPENSDTAVQRCHFSEPAKNILHYNSNSLVHFKIDHFWILP